MLMTVYWENARMNIEIVNLCKGEKDVKVKYRPTDNKELFENKKSDFLIPRLSKTICMGRDRMSDVVG